MFTLRLVTAMATLMGSSAIFAECEPTDDYCPPSDPQEGCYCEVEGELGCTADGEWHSEAFVCVEGVWVDTTVTGGADEAFCGGTSSFYGGCYWEPETDSLEVACAVPGFIGISKKRQGRKTTRRARGGRGLGITG